MENIRIAVIGLGYVGLPLAVEFSRVYPTIGFDTNMERIEELQNGFDRTGEISDAKILQTDNLKLTAIKDNLSTANFFVVAVPTPIDRENKPDLTILQAATELVSQHLANGDIVVFESTVYPGATEEVCVPILEQNSGLKLNDDYYVGYSPERINPGDKKHRLPDIVKVTSGSCEYAADIIDNVYKSIITAGTYKAESIRVAEAAKVIENTQRDLNVALMNELAIIFDLMDLDTEKVLEAAGTKWNFLPFQPGLVGGHCIGVDPYYLTHKATTLGYSPEIILSGRRINDGMGKYIVNRVLRLMTDKNIEIRGSRVLILGFAFKENCSDTRNTKVIDIVHGFKNQDVNVEVYDPCVDARQVEQEHGVSLLDQPVAQYDAIILAVAHEELIGFQSEVAALSHANTVVFDVKRAWPKTFPDGRL